MNWDVVDKNDKTWFVVHFLIVIATALLMAAEDYSGWGLAWCWATLITNGISAGIRFLKICRSYRGRDSENHAEARQEGG